MFGSTLTTSFQSLHPFRSSSSKASTQSERSSASIRTSQSFETEPFDTLGSYGIHEDPESSQARASMGSDQEFEEVFGPPPSYDDVVSDETYTPSSGTPITHHEAYRNRYTRRHHPVTPSRLVEYGLQSSKIYMSD